MLWSGQRDRDKAEWIQRTPWSTLRELEQQLRDGKPEYVKVSGKVATDFPITAEVSKELCAIYGK